MGAAGLSAWQLLLAKLNRLLRDPRLTRALKALRRPKRVAAACAAAGPSTLSERRRQISRASRGRIRLPRRLLLGAAGAADAARAAEPARLLRRQARRRAARALQPTRAGDRRPRRPSLPAVGMPNCRRRFGEGAPGARRARPRSQYYSAGAAPRAARRWAVAVREPRAGHTRLGDRRAQRGAPAPASSPRTLTRIGRHAPARTRTRPSARRSQAEKAGACS